MDGKEFESCGEELLRYMTSYLHTIRHRRPHPNVQPGFMRDLIPDRAPDTPETWSEVLRDVETVIMPGTVNPSCTELEVLMMDWLGQMLHLPDSFLFSRPGKGGGVIQTTASEGVLMCLLAARALCFRKEREKNLDVTMGQLIDKMIAYCSDQTHLCVERAGLLGAVRVRKLETDNKGSLQGHTLRAAILEDKAKGLVPFFVVATLGSTTSCAFDNLQQLGPVCQEHEIWMHVDAAYAGCAFICPEFRPLLDGVELAMSINVNAHKWLRVVIDCSLLWVRDTELLTEPYRVDGPYLRVTHQPPATDHDQSPTASIRMPDYRHWGLGLSRRFRALKLWFVIRLYGQTGLRDAIRRDVQLAHELEALMRTDDRFQIVADVIMGLVCFRLKGEDALSRSLVAAIQADGRLYLNSSELKGKTVIRFLINATATESRDIQYAWRVIRETADFILNPSHTQDEPEPAAADRQLDTTCLQVASHG